MKFVLLCLMVAFVAPSYGTRFSFGRRNWDIKSLMYVAGGTAQCDMCEMVVGDIQSLLEGQEPEIQNLLDSLCEDLPSEYRANCTSIVNSYLPILFALIDDMTPEEVCELLTLCTTVTEVPQFNRRQSPSSIFNYLLKSASRIRVLKDRRIDYFRNLVGEDYLCEACEDTISFVHEAVACNYTWNMVGELFGPLCEILPNRDACFRFFNELPSDVNDFANKYLDPIKDCGIFGFCSREELIINEEELIEAEVVEELVEQEIETVPEVLPVPVNVIPVSHRRPQVPSIPIKKIKKIKKPKKNKNLKRMGQRGMDSFGRRLRRAVIISIGGREDVNEIPYQFMYSTPGYETVPAHKKCEVCRYFSSAAEGVLEYNEEDITDGLTVIFEDICNALPDQWKSDCNTEIKDVLPAVMYQAALTLLNPDNLCTEVIAICQ